MADVPPADVLAELDAICAHDALMRSSRQVALLRYVVTATLEGRADELKEYTVGVSALGKPADFDPKLDSSVRSEASRLRGKLDAIYAAEPDAHAVRILLPKGHYVPTFVAVQTPGSPPVPAAVHGAVSGVPAGVATPPAQERRWLAALSVGAVAAMALAGAWYWRGRPAEPRPAGAAQVTRFDAFSSDRRFPKISPDGGLVVFSQDEGGLPFLYLSRANGTPLPLDLQGEHAAWSPDGREMVFRSERDGGGLFLLDVATKEIRRVSTAGFHPAWSPAGTHIVFSSERYARPEARLTTRSRLAVLDVNSGSIRPLALPASIDDAIEPVWSPDGRWIAFWSVDSGGRRDVFVLPAAGGRPVRVTEPDPVDWNPAWAPDGRLYWSSNQGGATNLWRVRIRDDGTPASPPESVPLPASYAGFFSFDRSGQLMYASVHAQWSIFRTHVSSGSQPAAAPVRLTPETLRVRHASLSPDGEHVAAFALDPHEDLVVFRRDGTGLRRLTNDVFRDRGPAWSPDGQRIAFVSNRGGDYQLWSVQPDGQGLAPLTQHPQGAFAPMWSHDGQRIAWFERGRHVNVTRVSATTPATIGLPGALSFTPTAWWQTDTALLGSRAGTDDDADTPLISYAIDTGSVREFGMRGRGPRWLVEGRVLLFLRDNTFYRRDVTSGVEQPVLALPGAVSHRYALAGDGSLYFDMQESRVELWTARMP